MASHIELHILINKYGSLHMPLIPDNHNLFTIDIEYTVPLEQVEAHIEAHIDFLNKHYDAGNFIVSGPKVPRNGGVIIAVSTSREKVKEIILEDAFHKAGIARYTITEFFPRMKAEGLK